jgi:hypothetical protein
MDSGKTVRTKAQISKELFLMQLQQLSLHHCNYHQPKPHQVKSSKTDRHAGAEHV